MREQPSDYVGKGLPGSGATQGKVTRQVPVGVFQGQSAACAGRPVSSTDCELLAGKDYVLFISVILVPSTALGT